ncbi:MAG: glycine cleavage system protein GcvH, partial [Acidimicrobiales bacterium]
TRGCRSCCWSQLRSLSPASSLRCCANAALLPPPCLLLRRYHLRRRRWPVPGHRDAASRFARPGVDRTLKLRSRVRLLCAGMNVPDDLRYSRDHEWARLEDGRVRVGITDYAQDALGDVVFVQLPEVGAKVEAGGTFGEIESTKSVSELYAPVRGSVAEINADLVELPQRLNEDPYGEGWICVIEPDDAGQLEQLLDAEAYRALIDG